jgi:cysteine-rich repeat protein
VLQGQLDACDHAADGDSCTFAGSVGQCAGGVCIGNQCGNGALDPGETCDAALGIDPVLGGTCSPDCQTIYRCGNGVVDPGEQCDDGNTNPADRCDACVLTRWRATAVLGAGRSPTSLALASPIGIAVDRAGDLFIALNNGHRAIRIDTSGAVTPIAGNGGACTTASCGDGGPATSAALVFPQSIAVDGVGNVYIPAGDRIRRVDRDGIMSTIAGTGVPSSSGDLGPATSATLNPGAIAVSGLGDVFVIDGPFTGGTVRRIDSAGIINTIVGAGQLYHPGGLAVDAAGTLYIADTGNHRVVRLDPGGLTTIAGGGSTLGDGGPATAAQLVSPTGLAFDALGNLYIGDVFDRRVRRVDSAGVITTAAGNGIEGDSGDSGPATSAEIDPVAIAVDPQGNLLVADAYEHIRRIGANGIITTIAGNGSVYVNDGTAATSVQISAIGVAVAGNGDVYATGAYRIHRIDTSGTVTTVVGNGKRGFAGDGGPALDASIYDPEGMTFDAAGNLYFADVHNGRIRMVDPAGVITTVAGTGGYGYSGDNGQAIDAVLAYPQGVAAHGGNLYIADSQNAVIRRVDSAGVITTVVGDGTSCTDPSFGCGDGQPATMAQLYSPVAVAFDATGNMYIADSSYDNRVRMVSVDGTITTLAGTGNYGYAGDGGAANQADLYGPNGLAVDATGNVYIADSYNDRIRRVDSGGTISTFAGNGAGGSGGAGVSGDGGAATNATIAIVGGDYTGIAVDAAGDLIFADVGGRCVRRVDTAGKITTIAGEIDPDGTGPLANSHFADPRAFVVSPPFTIAAGGSSRTVEVARTDTSYLNVVVAPSSPAISDRARYRGPFFGDVVGVAFDHAAGKIYLTESTNNRIHVVTLVDSQDETTWTISLLAGDAAGTGGFADGDALSAKFRDPTGLYLDEAARVLYVADTGNHVVRTIDLASNAVATVTGTPQNLGFFGDGGLATDALLYRPQALTRCPNGDLFVADTGNERVRRVAADHHISTVLGTGEAASAGEGAPASTLPVDTPVGIACDAVGNVFVTSRSTVRLLPANDSGVVDGSGPVETIYGAIPRNTFPSSVTACLTGIVVIDAMTVQVADSCTGLIVALERDHGTP